MSKILVFSHNCFSNRLNNGITLSNLFSSFSKNEICQLFISTVDNPNYDICNNYYQITDINLIKNNKKNGPLPNIENKETSKRIGSIINHSEIFKLSLKFIRDIIWMLFIWNTDKLKEWINRNKVDGIFFVGGDACFSHKMARKIAKQTNIPLYTYFTDDYIIYNIPSNLLQRLYHVRLKRQYKKTISCSKKLFVIGTEMSKEYESFYKRKFIPIMNSVDIKKATPIIVKQELIFNFFGGLHLNRWKSIIELSIILKKYIDRPYSINIYTFNLSDKTIISELEKYNINIHEGVRGEDYTKTLLNSSFLIHVESFDEEYRKLTRLSVSTKIPEYLMSNRPIIALGPKEVASIKLLKNNNIGLCLDEKDEVTINRLVTIITDIEEQSSLAQRGYNFAVKNFDKKKQSKMLYNELMK